MTNVQDREVLESFYLVANKNEKFVDKNTQMNSVLIVCYKIYFIYL